METCRKARFSRPKASRVVIATGCYMTGAGRIRRCVWREVGDYGVKPDKPKTLLLIAAAGRSPTIRYYLGRPARHQVLTQQGGTDLHLGGQGS
jgi:hypothetical protein